MNRRVPSKNILEKCWIETDYNWYHGDLDIFYNDEGQFDYNEEIYKLLHEDTSFMEQWGKIVGPLDGNVRRVLFKDQDGNVISEIIEPNPMYLEDIFEEDIRKMFDEGKLY